MGGERGFELGDGHLCGCVVKHVQHLPDGMQMVRQSRSSIPVRHSVDDPGQLVEMAVYDLEYLAELSGALVCLVPVGQNFLQLVKRRVVASLRSRTAGTAGS